MRYFAIIFILFSQSLWAQISPVPGVGANWTIARFGMFGLESTSAEGYSATGDSIINGRSYVNIGGGLFRDSLDIWYCIKQGEIAEHVIFDFNLEQSDTLYFHNPFLSNEFPEEYHADYAIVSSVDSIELMNGVWNKYMEVTTFSSVFDSSGDIWVAGIGSLGDMFRFGYVTDLMDEGFAELICFENEFGELLYENPVPNQTGMIPQEVIYENCNWYVGIEELDWLSINLFPNPATTNLNIEGEFIIDEIRIYDLIGQLVFSENLSSYSAQVDVSKLKIGVYFMNVHSRGQEVTLRFVKE